MNLYWTQMGNKKVANYKGFTLTMIGHKITVTDDLHVIPDKECSNLRPALAHIETISNQRRSLKEDNIYSLGCCDEL